MNRESLLKMTGLFLNHPESKDWELVSIAQAQGLSLEQAERVVAFLPIAFGRVIIRKLGKITFSDYFYIKDSTQKFSLKNEPIFVQGLSIAIESQETGLVPRECFSAIAKRSHELGAVSKALDAGENLNGGEMGPAVLFGYKTLGKNKSWLRSLLG